MGRKTFDAVCRLAQLKPNILVESRAPHTLLALAETGLGIAIVPSVIRTHRYRLHIVQIAYKRKAIKDARAVVWDKRRVLPRYAKDFCQLLAAYVRDSQLHQAAFAPVSAPTRGTQIMRLPNRGPRMD